MTAPASGGANGHMTLARLPPQPTGTAWPTLAWPEGELPKGIANTAFAALIDEAFKPAGSDWIGRTDSLVIIQGGQLLFERYGQGKGPDDTYPSWSMAKSITQALVGLIVAEGKIDIHAPADAPEWRGAGDPRGAITLDQLLRMSSGLAFNEEYDPQNPSDVIEMLWGRGKDDVGAFAAGFPLAHAPGSFWSYSSGTTNIVARAAARAVDRFGPDFEAFMRDRLFDPLGMTTPVPKFDAAGTFIGSSFCFSSARDFARFGLLYLRGGVWEGRQLLPAAWVDYARTPTWQQPTEDGPYGAHWWIGMGGPGSFSCNGHEGQYIVCVPDLDLILVRNGLSPTEQKNRLRDEWIPQVIGCFRALAD